MDFQDVSNLATAVGAVAGVFALVFAGFQLKKTLDVERGRFMLELQRMLTEHDAMHLKLRPGGPWSGASAGPADAAEWVPLESYLAFFEHCEILLETESLDLESFKAIFGYRLANIARNTVITARLSANRDDWQKIHALCGRLGLSIAAAPPPPAAAAAV